MMKYLLAVVCLLLAPFVQAHEYALKEMRIGHPYATPSVSGQSNGAAYLTLENKGKDVVRLLRASTPVAARAELHHMAVENNVAHAAGRST